MSIGSGEFVTYEGIEVFVYGDGDAWVVNTATVTNDEDEDYIGRTECVYEACSKASAVRAYVEEYFATTLNQQRVTDDDPDNRWREEDEMRILDRDYDRQRP